MTGLNIFIVGMEKSGTTSLADWLVKNQLARYRVPGVKEPNLYAQAGHTPIPDSLHHNGILLDASVGYATNSYAVSRMPEHNTKIVLCLRNSFERTFSAYNFFRIICRRNQASSELLKSSIDLEQENPVRTLEDTSENAFFESQFQYTKILYPTKSEGFIRKYFMEQAENISKQSFVERIQYEVGFHLSRRTFPFFSILANSFFTFPLKNILTKYNPADIHLVTLDKLDLMNQRRAFVDGLLGTRTPPRPLPPIPNLNTSSTNSEREPKPDFQAPEFNLLRNWFRQDIESFEALIHSTSTSREFINFEILRKNMTLP